MESYRIVLSNVATEDIIDIGKYITYDLHNPQAAQKLIDKFYAEIAKLTEMPQRHELLKDEYYIIPDGIRRIYVDNYSVYYLCNEEMLEVEVVRVLYNKREWQNLL